MRKVPIRCVSIAAYVCKIERGRGKYLLLKRAGRRLCGQWQMVAGKIERGESAAQAALREVKEETGLVPERFYSADSVELFYAAGQDRIELSPVFVGFVRSSARVRLSREHSAFRWVSCAHAVRMVIFSNQRRDLARLEREFIRKRPNEFFRIRLRGPNGRNS